MANSDTITLSILTHILGWFTGFIGPLIILLVSEDKVVKKHSRIALNWQISLIIYMLVSLILALLIVGIFFIIALVVMNMVFSIIAAVKASNNDFWNYPMAIPFLKIE